MNLEPATQQDINAVFLLLSRCKDNLVEQGIFQWDDEYPNLGYVEHDISKGSLIKLTNNGQLVGIVSFDDIQEPEYIAVEWLNISEPIAVIHRLAVDPLFQGKGYAKVLMQFAEKSLFEAGFQSIRLDAYRGNEMLLGFYTKLGYQKVGTINFPRRKLPFICMEKSI